MKQQEQIEHLISTIRERHPSTDIDNLLEDMANTLMGIDGPIDALKLAYLNGFLDAKGSI
tara:strand:- start:21481 stop:21660 length:180 start_codon:yes stop_codon:yes gene_type:complete